jgi:4-alpha-methyl-delta7-sterol-4alpha-methyl oxidase
MHLYTFILYITLRTVEGFDAHCGYELPWSPVRLLPLTSKNINILFDIDPSSFHDFHHSGNIGNYAAWFCHLDFFFGTSHYFYEKKCSNIKL